MYNASHSGSNLLSSCDCQQLLFEQFGPEDINLLDNRPLHLPRHAKPIYSTNITLASLLANHTLDVRIAQFHSILPYRNFVTTISVNGQSVLVPDIPANNGALHVIDQLIKPKRNDHNRHPASQYENWENWEEWLPQWASET